MERVVGCRFEGPSRSLLRQRPVVFFLGVYGLGGSGLRVLGFPAWCNDRVHGFLKGCAFV